MPGVLEEREGLNFQTNHIKEIDKIFADGITWWNKEDIQIKLTDKRYDTPRQVQELKRRGLSILSQIFTRIRMWKGCCVNSENFPIMLEDVSRVEDPGGKRVLTGE